MRSIKALTTEIVKGHRRIDEIMRFAITGGLATLLQYGIYVVFVDAIKVAPVLSTPISYAISFIANYFLSTYFTFQSKPNKRNTIGFILSHVINMGMQTGVVAIFAQLVGNTLALLPAFGICIPLNYLMVRYAFKGRIFMTRQQKESIRAERERLSGKPNSI